MEIWWMHGHTGTSMQTEIRRVHSKTNTIPACMRYEVLNFRPCVHTTCSHHTVHPIAIDTTWLFWKFSESVLHSNLTAETHTEAMAPWQINYCRARCAQNNRIQTKICETDQHTVRKTPEHPQSSPRKLSNLLPAAWLCPKQIRRPQISWCTWTQSCTKQTTVIGAPVFGNQSLKHAWQRKYTGMGGNTWQRENRQKNWQRKCIQISLRTHFANCAYWMKLRMFHYTHRSNIA